MPSDARSRSKTRGFTLLEAMLAFAILSMVLAASYAISVRSMRHEIGARQNYESAAMARALLDEYVLTYPAMASAGTYKGTWHWLISEAPQEVLESTEHDHYFTFVRITAQVTREGLQAEPYQLSTIVARRAPGL